MKIRDSTLKNQAVLYSPSSQIQRYRWIFKRLRLIEDLNFHLRYLAYVDKDFLEPLVIFADTLFSHLENCNFASSRTCLIASGDEGLE